MIAEPVSENAGRGDSRRGVSDRAAPPRRCLARRHVIKVMAAFGVAGLTWAGADVVGRRMGMPERPFPDWVFSMPRGGEAYAAAYSDLPLMEALPCFCGCMSFADPHKSLRTCFEQPSGEIEPHGAFCETCQGEAIDAVALARQGLARPEIHDRIVAAYGN